MYFDFRFGWTLFKVRKVVSRSARSQSWLFPFKAENAFHKCTSLLCKKPIHHFSGLLETSQSKPKFGWKTDGRKERHEKRGGQSKFIFVCIPQFWQRNWLDTCTLLHWCEISKLLPPVQRVTLHVTRQTDFIWETNHFCYFSLDFRSQQSFGWWQVFSHVLKPRLPGQWGKRGKDCEELEYSLHGTPWCRGYDEFKWRGRDAYVWSMG